MTFSSTGKLWVLITTIVCLLDIIIEPIDGQTPIMKPIKRRYKLIPFYDDDIRISDPSKPALIQDLLLLSHVLNNTADTVFGSKDIVRDLLTFFADLDQIMIQWLFLFLICSSFFHAAACACIGCCACYVFKNEIRNTLKFAKQQPKSSDQPPGTSNAPEGELPVVPPLQSFQKGTTHTKEIDD